MLKVEFEEKGPTLILKFVGEFGSSDIGNVREEVDRRTKDESVKNLVIDLSNTTMLDSSGISFLITLFKRMVDKGGKLIIVSPSDVVKRTLEICNLHKVFRVVDSVENAVKNI